MILAVLHVAHLVVFCWSLIKLLTAPRVLPMVSLTLSADTPAALNFATWALAFRRMREAMSCAAADALAAAPGGREKEDDCKLLDSIGLVAAPAIDSCCAPPLDADDGI